MPFGAASRADNAGSLHGTVTAFELKKKGYSCPGPVLRRFQTKAETAVAVEFGPERSYAAAKL